MAIQILRAPPPGLPTPYAWLDHARLLRNLTRVQNLATAAGLALRPHIKTHKSLEIMRLQLALGAHGVTAAKPSEALPFIQESVPALLLAFPIIDPDRVGDMIEAAKVSGTKLTFILDSDAGRYALNEAGRRAQMTLDVQIKVDVGLGRSGVPSTSDALIELAVDVAHSSFLKLTGLLSHAGHGYGATGLEQLASIAQEERRQILEARDRLNFLETSLILSVGSTPTVLAGTDFSELHEIRPGNYALFDLTAVRLGVASEDEIAFGVVTTIVGRNDGFYIVDAGSKALSSDLGPHSSGGLGGFGRAIVIDRPDVAQRLAVSRLSEEHGFVARSGTDLPIGTRLLILPNHSCPVVNLYDRIVVAPDGKVQSWAVAARGALT